LRFRPFVKSGARLAIEPDRAMATLSNCGRLGRRTLMRATRPNIVWFHLSTSPEGGRVMSSNSQLSNPAGWDWTSWMKGPMPNPLDFFAAPRNFVQPILPGWFGIVTNITEQNSSAPETEREIVAAQSYGRQLGRVMDALAVVIADLPKEQQDAPPFEEFAKLRSEIDGIKAQAAARRLDRIAADLATLKATKPEEYERLAATLRKALEGAS
jgi:hypothetical protein